MSRYNSYSSGMYERKLDIDEFHGVDQSRGIHSPDYGSSPDAVNFISRHGELRTVNGVSKYGVAAPKSAYESADGRLFQGFFRNEDGTDFSKIIMALHGRLYTSDINAQKWTPVAGNFNTNDWSAVNYRDETNEWVIFTNGVDQAQYWDGKSSASFPLKIIQGKVIETTTDESGNEITEIISPGEELHFSEITLLHERLWGGVSSDYPDRVYWSNTFDPEDWELNFEDSEQEGGGFIDVATFDGSRIRAVMNAMDDVLIFKDKSLHRLSGTYPGEFAVTQVFGTDGTLAPRTIVSNGSSLYFLSSDGLVRYNGMEASALSASGDRKLKDIWDRINDSTIDTSCAVLRDNVIYLAVPLDGSIINTHVIEYHLLDGTYSIIDLPGVDDWLLLREGQKETLLFLSGDQIYQYDKGYVFFDGTPINAVWTSPSITCGSISSRKQTGRIYMTVSAISLDVDKDPQIKISLFSGEKVRTKIISLKPGINEIRKRVKIRGRNFRFRIENVDGNPLTIHKGIEIHIEEDFD